MRHIVESFSKVHIYTIATIQFFIKMIHYIQQLQNKTFLEGIHTEMHGKTRSLYLKCDLRYYMMIDSIVLTNVEIRLTGQ